MPGILMPCGSKGGGIAMGMPNVCKTPAPPAPPIPIPYPSMSQLASTDGAVEKVLVMNKETVAEGAKIPNSNGDEAGTAGGVVSGVNSKEVMPKLFSTKVFAGGKKCVMHTAMMGCNGSNANMPAGVHMAPSQPKVFVGM